MIDDIGEKAIKLGTKCKNIGIFGGYSLLIGIIFVVLYGLFLLIGITSEILMLIVEISSVFAGIGLSVFVFYFVGYHYLCLGKIECNTRMEKLEEKTSKRQIDENQSKILIMVAILALSIVLLSVCMPVVMYESTTKLSGKNVTQNKMLTGINFIVNMFKNKETNMNETAAGIVCIIQLVLAIVCLVVCIFLFFRRTKKHKIYLLIVIICFVLNIFYYVTTNIMIKAIDVDKIKFTLTYLPVILSFFVLIAYLGLLYKFIRK